MLTYLWTFGVGAVFGIFLTYFHEKAKNFAIMQDIGRITEQIENVKQQNILVLEEVRGRHQLRLAALDRRLQAHQEAFTLWRKLLSKAHKADEIGNFVMDCQDWWDKNCLYLSPEARLAFRTAYQSAFDHKDFLTDKSNTELIRENWKRIEYAGNAIVQGAELPPLGDQESESLKSE
jgi:hypothetical protein